MKNPQAVYRSTEMRVLVVTEGGKKEEMEPARLYDPKQRQFVTKPLPLAAYFKWIDDLESIPEGEEVTIELGAAS